MPYPLPALDIQQPANPLDQASKVISLKALLDQQEFQRQMRPLQLQQEQQETQQRQIALDQSKALMQASQGVDWTKDDAFDKFAANANATGKVNPQALSAIALQRAQYREQIAKTDTATLDAIKNAHSQLNGHIDTVRGITDPAKRAQAVQDQATQILNTPEIMKYTEPAVQQMLAAMKSGRFVPDDDHLTFLENGLTDRNTQIEQALKAQQTQEATAKTEQAKAETAKTIAETQGLTGPMADSKYRNILMKQYGKQPLTPDEAAFKSAYEGQKKLVPMSVAQVRLEGMGKIRQFPVYDNQTKQTVYLDSNEINDAKLREPGRYTVPQFTPESIIQQQTGKAFAPGGKAGEEVLSFETAKAHADLLRDAATALQNGDTQALNSLKNKWAEAFGSALPTNAKEIADVYTHEVTKAIARGHITNQEIADRHATVDPTRMSPAQITGAMDNYKALMQSKINLRGKQLEAGKRGQSTIESQSAGVIYARDPQGKLHSAPSGTALPEGWTKENR